MKRIPPLLALALTLAGAVLFSAGCANLQQTAPTNRPLTYALVATVNGSQPPTDAQWATLLKKFEELLAARGVKLLVDPSLADKLIQVQFYPDADDPTMGTIYVVGISTNPGASLVARSSTPSRTSSSYASTSYHSNSLYPQYYGYFNDYTSDYGYNSSTYTGGNSTVTRPTTPPTHTTRPVICPPDSGHSSGGYAGGHPSDGSRHRPYPESSGSYSSGSSSSGSSYSSSSSSSGSSSSYSSSSGSSYSGSSSNYSSGSSSYSSGSSSSYSTPSYSPPSYESASTPSGRDGGSQQQPR